MGDIERVRHISPVGFERVGSGQDRKRREGRKHDDGDEDVIELHSEEGAPETEPDHAPPDPDSKSRIDIRS